jgi:hypothetical protein
MTLLPGVCVRQAGAGAGGGGMMALYAAAARVAPDMNAQNVAKTLWQGG